MALDVGSRLGHYEVTTVTGDVSHSGVRKGSGQ